MATFNKHSFTTVDTNTHLGIIFSAALLCVAM
ncbi:MAG: triphosphoribosyl-dephospho-CoA synthase [Gammaproteobacteria bacterium]|nr:triphosphoribosyl-dephospho-CoA synthase [Gammaproteobacteria bacterium]